MDAHSRPPVGDIIDRGRIMGSATPHGQARDRADRRRFRRAVLAACAMLVLSACSAKDLDWLNDTPFSFIADLAEPASDSTAASNGPTDTKNPSNGSRDIKDQLAKAVPAPRARPAAPPPRSGGNGSVRRTNRPRTVAPRESKRFNPNKLVGLDERQVVRLLGQPERVETKLPATVWSYTIAKCTLDLFFYLDVASGGHRVLAYEVNSKRGSKETKKVCLGRIQSALRTN